MEKRRKTTNKIPSRGLIIFLTVFYKYIPETKFLLYQKSPLRNVKGINVLLRLLIQDDLNSFLMSIALDHDIHGIADLVTAKKGFHFCG